MTTHTDPPFHAAIRRAPPIFDRDLAASTLEATSATGAARDLLAAAAGGAPFLARLIQREAAWLETIWDAPAERTFLTILTAIAPLEDGASVAPEAPFGTALRVARRRTALLVALADLGGVWDVDAVTGALTRFADRHLSLAVDGLLQAEAARGAIPGFDLAKPAYVALAMGKMGAHELNYSSDIDLIILFDEDRFATALDAVAAKDRFIRLTRSLVKLLSERTAEGYVARVDLRLRPDPGATPVCQAMGPAELYYESMARTWERAAYIKARPAAGDVAAGEAFLDRLKPFIWRRHLDFAALEDAADMLARIRAHEGGGDIAVAGQDVKLGAGGIREIELLAQSRQLVLGGRDASLRQPRTRDALRALMAAGRLDAGDQSRLDQAYAHLRTLEHRLQMVEDQQTHRMPTKPEALARVAALMDYGDWPSLEADTRRHMEAVRQVAGGDLDERRASGPSVAQTVDVFPEPDRAKAIVSAWFDGRLRAVRSERARKALERLSPGVLIRLADAPDPMRALLSFDRFLHGLPAGAQLLALIEANPKLLDLLTEICATAPKLADHLSRRAAVLDAVLDADFFAAPPALDARIADLQAAVDQAAVDQAGDYERTLDAVRRWAAEKRFQIGVLLLQGVLAPIAAGAAYADVAEACLVVLWPVVVDEFARRSGPPPGGGAAAVALGRLGSREMTATSDLDLIVIYDAEPTDVAADLTPALSKRPPAAQYYARFTQVLIAALTAPTSEGALYDVDLRLRPSGRSGPLATSLASFARYQREDAWVWEHLAMTRARAVTGAPALKQSIADAIAEALSRPRDPGAIATAAAEMRAKLADAHAAEAADPWALKFARGGLFDVEFVVQVSVLENGVAGSGGLSISEALERLAACGAPSTEEIAALQDAYRLQAALLQLQRIVVDGRFDPETAGAGVRAALSRATGFADFTALSNALRTQQEAATAIYQTRIGRHFAPGDASPR